MAKLHKRNYYCTSIEYWNFRELTALGIEDDNWLETLICEFNVYADENGEVDLEEFDITMDQLYDWADQRVEAMWKVEGIDYRTCWIKTW